MGGLSKYAVCTLPAVLCYSLAKQGLALFTQQPEQTHVGGVERGTLGIERFSP